MLLKENGHSVDDDSETKNGKKNGNGNGHSNGNGNGGAVSEMIGEIICSDQCKKGIESKHHPQNDRDKVMWR